MAFAVEMYLDAKTEAKVRDLWAALAAAGVTSYLPDAGARPHVSLAVFPQVSPAYLRTDLAEFARKTLPLPIQLATVGLFPLGPDIVYIAPVVAPSLIEMHRSYHERLAVIGVESAEYYWPGRWVPHCTAGMRIPPGKIPAAVKICMNSQVFGNGLFVEIGLVEDPQGPAGRTTFWYTFPLGREDPQQRIPRRSESPPSEPVLETERLWLRPTHADDVDDVFEYMGDPEVMRYKAWGVQTHEQVADWVARMARTGAAAPFVGRIHQVVLKATGNVIGYCYLDRASPEGYREVLEGRTEPLVEITYGLARPYWRFGYAGEAARAMLRHGFEVLHLPEIVAAVNPANIASISILERIGMSWRRKILWRGLQQVDYYTITRQEYEQTSRE